MKTKSLDVVRKSQCVYWYLYEHLSLYSYLNGLRTIILNKLRYEDEAQTYWHKSRWDLHCTKCQTTWCPRYRRSKMTVVTQNDIWGFQVFNNLSGLVYIDRIQAYVAFKSVFLHIRRNRKAKATTCSAENFKHNATRWALRLHPSSPNVITLCTSLTGILRGGH